eukprot:45010-Eustigmatos_ZCMA.PRE.1
MIESAVAEKKADYWRRVSVVPCFLHFDAPRVRFQWLTSPSTYLAAVRARMLQCEDGDLSYCRFIRLCVKQRRATRTHCK